MKCHWGQAAAIGLAVGTLTTACTGSTRAGGTATVPPSPTTTDPWAVPAVIDTPYLQRVMDRLDQSTGDALRELVAARSVDARVEEILKAVYSGAELQRSEHDYRAIAATDLAKYRAVPGNPKTEVIRILGSASGCTYFSATRTIAPALINPPPVADTRAFLAIQQAKTQDRTLNPTNQMLILDALSTTGTTPRSPCG